MNNEEPRRLIVAGVCKDIVAELPKTLKRLEELQALLPGTQFVIYENNSVDGTRDVLRSVSGRPGWHVFSETVADEVIRKACIGFSRQDNPCRMEVIAIARNRLMEEIEKIVEKGERYHVLMIDLDIWDWEPAQIPELCGKEGWDAISVNSTDRAGNYRDASAFRSRRFPLGPEQLGDYWWNKICMKIHRQHLRRGLVPVLSAFGGLTIYRWEAIEGLRYAGVVNDEYHKDFLSRRKETRPGFAARFALWKIGREQKAGTASKYSKRSDLFGDGSFYLNNSGYDYPVVCEHVPFHAAMRNRGAGSIFVCTDWKARI